jgi:hypothetical protein
MHLTPPIPLTETRLPGHASYLTAAALFSSVGYLGLTMASAEPIRTLGVYNCCGKDNCRFLDSTCACPGGTPTECSGCSVYAECCLSRCNHC